MVVLNIYLKKAESWIKSISLEWDLSVSSLWRSELSAEIIKVSVCSCFPEVFCQSRLLFHGKTQTDFLKIPLQSSPDLV